jgi:hypothetical protein
MRIQTVPAWVARLVCGSSLALALGLLALGCGTHGAPPETAEVSGHVYFQKKPLPGGSIAFITEDGRFSGTGTIDEKGAYIIHQAPVGRVRVSVDNRALSPRGVPGKGAGKGAKKGRGKLPGAAPVLKRPGGGELSTLKGTYKEIPGKYWDPEQSGLTYEVTPGSQTKDFSLD